jgi:hypothetical protein
VSHRAIKVSSQVINLLEDISVQKIEKWEADFKNLFKGLSSQKTLKSPDDFSLLKKGLETWSSNFHQFVMKNVLGVGLVGRDRMDLFLKKPDSNSVHYFQGMVYEIHLKSSMLPVVTEKNLEEVKKKLKDLEDTAKYVFGVLKKGLSKIKDPLSDLWVESPQIQVGPVSVQVISKEGTSDKYIKDFVHDLDSAVRTVQEKHLTPALKGARVVIDLQTQPQSAGLFSHAAAVYNYETDNITSNSARKDPNLYATLLHEIGHRYWYKVLTSRQRKAWIDFIATRKIIIPKIEVEKILQAISDFFDEKSVPLPWSEVPGTTSSWFEALLNYLEVQFKSQEPTYTYVKALATTIHDIVSKPLTFRSGVKAGAMNTINFGLSQASQEGVLVDPITGYSNVNDREAWSEVFRLYCEDKPLPELVELQFKQLLA